MKKTLLTTIFALISLVTFAQIPSIGIKGGLSLATTVTNDGGSNFTSGVLPTFNAGLFVDLRFGKFSLQPALNYVGEGQSYGLNAVVPITSNGTETGSNFNGKDHLYYSQLPVNVVYHIPVIIGNIYFGAGPYIAEGISAKTTYTNGNPSQKLTFGNGVDDAVRPTQFGADAIIGLKLKGGLLLNVNYDIGITNDLPSVDAGSSRKSRVLGIALGYVFL